MSRIDAIRSGIAQRLGLRETRAVIERGADDVDAEERKRRKRISNRHQKILFVLLTLAITAGGVGLAVFLAKPTQLVFAVPDTTGPEFQFATKLAGLAQNSRTFKIVVSPGDAAALPAVRLGQGKADLAILRADGRVPPSARAVAVLEHDVILLIAPKGAKLKSLSSIKGRRIVVLGANPRDVVLTRQLLAVFDPGGSQIDERPRSELASLLETGGQIVIVSIAPKSQLVAAKDWDILARKPGFELIDIDGAKALERRLRGVTSETIEAGLVASSPRTPPKDIDGLSIDELLVVRNRTSGGIVSELARMVLENKEGLALDGLYASAIEPPDVDKDAAIVAHQGAADYVNGEVKSFAERYSDVLYLSLSLASIVGSLSVALYSTLTRVPPVRASELTDDILAIAAKIDAAQSLDEIAGHERTMESVLRDMLSGLKDKSVTTEGFEVFRLAFDMARESLRTARDRLVLHDTQKPQNASTQDTQQQADAALSRTR